MASYNEISTNALSRLLGTPECPVLLDVRIEEDVAADTTIIPGARAVPFADVATLAAEFTGKAVVVYCQKGLKLSQGAAAILRAEGTEAEVLEGGHIAWRDAGLPLLNITRLPWFATGEPSLWVTRHRPKIDRIACPWLIRRFIDPRARFMFVAPSQVLNVADRFGALSFDVDGADFGHEGETCSFDALLAGFGLTNEPLDILARIIRGADTDRPDLAPEATGLLAVSLGLSRMYRRDAEQLEAGLVVYDALYRWARDAQGERHDWHGIDGA